LVLFFKKELLPSFLMALRRRGGATALLNPWPGYVDALSTLLMVLVFVLLVFVLAQAFLSVALSGRDQALDRLGRQVAELADMLSLEKGRSAELSDSVTQLTQDLRAAQAARDSAAAEASGLRDALAAATTARDAATASAATLKARVADAAVELESAQKRLSAAETKLADTADKASADNLARLSDQVRALLALRDQLAGQVTAAAEQNRALTQKLADSTHLAESAQAQVALLTKQIDALRTQLAQIAAALDLAHKDAQAKDARIADLGAKLNAALVSKVAELQRYRSEFFGRLRDVLAGRPGIAVVGDRFVFQSEVLFPPGSADLSASGAAEIRKLAATLKDLQAKIPADIPWVLRVDGHADRQAVHGKFASNWELSAERAINVVRLLAADGIPPNRLAAAGFGEFQPLDAGNTPAAYAKNRRIELRLTDR
jgi:chemotaxis protein MotB